MVGVAQFCYLKEKYKQKGGVIYIVYMRYLGHGVYHHGTEEGIIAMQEMNYCKIRQNLPLKKYEFHILLILTI